MYAKGMTTRDIEDHMRDIYGIVVSPVMVSKVTDKIMPMIAEWQSRPLERVYPIIYLDTIFFKVRKDNRIINKAAYSVLGINMAGQKDILGIWIGENESASFWLGVCNDLKNRGVQDILIACKDGLSGFSEAINTVFPRTEIQLCIIHQIRNSLKYVPWKEQKELMANLKKVYQALTMDEAELAFEMFKEKWGKKHPVIIRSWEKNWLELTAYYNGPKNLDTKTGGLKTQMSVRKKYPADFKTKIVLEILKEEKSLSQISSEYGIHTTQLNRWKKQALEGLPQLFTDERKSLDAIRIGYEKQIQDLYAEVGRLTTQLNWLKKKSGL